jgi:hypothetical protein
MNGMVRNNLLNNSLVEEIIGHILNSQLVKRCFIAAIFNVADVNEIRLLIVCAKLCVMCDAV